MFGDIKFFWGDNSLVMISRFVANMNEVIWKLGLDFCVLRLLWIKNSSKNKDSLNDTDKEKMQWKLK